MRSRSLHTAHGEWPSLKRKPRHWLLDVYDEVATFLVRALLFGAAVGLLVFVLYFFVQNALPDLWPAQPIYGPH